MEQESQGTSEQEGEVAGSRGSRSRYLCLSTCGSTFHSHQATLSSMKARDMFALFIITFLRPGTMPGPEQVLSKHLLKR